MVLNDFKLEKCFKKTPPEIEFCTFWWYPLKPEVKFLKRPLPEVVTGNCNLNSFPRIFDIYNHLVFRHNPITCQLRKIKTLGSKPFLEAWLLSQRRTQFKSIIPIILNPSWPLSIKFINCTITHFSEMVSIQPLTLGWPWFLFCNR